MSVNGLYNVKAPTRLLVEVEVNVVWDYLHVLIVLATTQLRIAQPQCKRYKPRLKEHLRNFHPHPAPPGRQSTILVPKRGAEDTAYCIYLHDQTICLYTIAIYT